MTVPEDGIYEAEDLFYVDGWFTVKVSGGEMEFFRKCLYAYAQSEDARTA